VEGYTLSGLAIRIPIQERLRKMQTFGSMVSAIALQTRRSGVHAVHFVFSHTFLESYSLTYTAYYLLKLPVIYLFLAV
jgi:hypothetical protein